MMDLTACLSGEKRAWDAFVERYAPVIFAAVQRTVRYYKASLGADEIHDLAQEVFVRLVKSDYRLLRSYDPARSSLSTWLTLVARSSAIDFLRRQRPAPLPLETDDIAAPDARSDGAAVDGLEIPKGLLTPRQQLVVQLLFGEGLSVREAADVLGVDVQTVRSTKHKALIRLRQFFDSG